MTKDEINNLNVFELYNLLEIMENTANYISKNIPDYASMVTKGETMTVGQKLLLDKYNIIKKKSHQIRNMLENKIIEDINVD